MEQISKEEKLKYWGEGDWVDEQDNVEFEHNGLRCLVTRVCMPDGPDHIYGGHLCGYVALPEEMLKYKEAELPDFDIHGGITFHDEHLMLKQEAVGFDCAHSSDICPSMEMLTRKLKSHAYIRSSILFKSYKNIHFVIDETKYLADQVSYWMKNKTLDGFTRSEYEQRE